MNINIITMKLLEKYLALDIIRYIDTFVYIKLNNIIIKNNVKLYFKNKEQSYIYLRRIGIHLK